MMPRRYEKVLLRRNKLQLQMTVYDEAGQSIQRTIPGGVIDLDTYMIRHVFIGEWRLSFPNGDPTRELSGVNVFPNVNVNSPEGFSWEALSAGSMYYCVVPLGLKGLAYEDRQVDAGASLELPLSTLSFIFGDEFSVNGRAYSGRAVVAGELVAGLVTAASPVRVITFQNREVQPESNT